MFRQESHSEVAPTNQFWDAALEDTVEQTAKLIEAERRRETAANWLSSYANDKPTSSNQGVENLAFQRWFQFKEAFSPKFVADTITSRPYTVQRCLDPFGGSGTTALTSRMLGLRSVTSEVNPFLADLIAAKLTPLNPQKFFAEVEMLIRNMDITEHDASLPDGFPPTFVEPGVSGRYIFSRDVFAAARCLLRMSEKLSASQQRLIRVLIASVLVENSNVRISGKGRRYRKNWQDRVRTSDDFMSSFRASMDMAVKDLETYKSIPKGDHRVLVGDSRKTLSRVHHADIALFSPPYPNSFDYTDVYNVELWMLNYLTSLAENRVLRQATLRSHVQTKWGKAQQEAFHSAELVRVIEGLNDNLDRLWDKNIPNMITAYFVDLYDIFLHLKRILPLGHDAVLAVGDSRYADVLIDMSKVLPEVVRPLGFEVESQNAIRSMRSSAQHGGRLDLSEHCMVFRKII